MHLTLVMKFVELLELIYTNQPITIIGSNSSSTSEMFSLYFAIYHNPRCFDKVSISGSIIFNPRIKLSVRGRVAVKEDMKSVHFVNIRHLKRWMLETNEVDETEDMTELDRYFGRGTRTLFKPRTIIVLDHVQIPDSVNPYITVVNHVGASSRHRNWEICLKQLISTFQTKIGAQKLDEFTPLSDAEIDVLMSRHHFNHHSQSIAYYDTFGDYDFTKEDFDTNTHMIDTYDPDDVPKNVDVKELQERIIYIQQHEPDIMIPELQCHRITNIRDIHWPKLIDVLMSMNETQLLPSSNTSLTFQPPSNILIFNPIVNGLPKLVKYISPNYLDMSAWQGIHILRLDYKIVDTHHMTTIKQVSRLIANPNIHNTVNFEIVNGISDEYRNMNGVDFMSVAKEFINDIKTYHITSLVSHGTDVNYNALLTEFRRHLISLDIFRGIQIINTKQYLWKRDVKERIDSYEFCRGLSKLDMIYALLRYRCRW